MPTLTIEVTAAQAQRIAAAYGELLTPPGTPVAPATLPQIRQAIVDSIKQTVLAYEHRQALQQVVTNPIDLA